MQFVRQSSSKIVLDHVKSLQSKPFSLPTDVIIKLLSSNNPPLVDTFYCQVCLEHRDVKDQVVLPCDEKHSFCKTCTATQLTREINQNNVPVRCWHVDECSNVCHKDISQSWIKETKDLVSAQVLLNYQSRMIHKDPAVADCPKCQYINTQTKLDSVGKPIPEVVCTKCQTPFCLIHSSQHANQTCAAFLASQKEDTATAKFIKRTTKKCPNFTCQALIAKTGGCNKMTCQQCKTHFCWLCSEILGDDVFPSHFTTGECRQFGDTGHTACVLFMASVAVIPALVVGIPVGLLFALVVCLLLCCCCCKKDACVAFCSQSCTVWFLIFAGIFFVILIIPLLIIGTIWNNTVGRMINLCAHGTCRYPDPLKEDVDEEAKNEIKADDFNKQTV